MHHIYHTEGIILSSTETGESAKYYHILTKDLGMIVASARGVRKLSSKLRFVLQDFSYVKLDLVRGKDFWRITSAGKTGKLEGLSRNTECLRVMNNIFRLLKRLMAGEEPNHKLFMDTLKGFSFLEDKAHSQNIQNIEVIIVLRILEKLGYIGNKKSLVGLSSSPFEERMVLEAAHKRKDILREINRALKETHL